MRIHVYGSSGNSSVAVRWKMKGTMRGIQPKRESESVSPKRESRRRSLHAAAAAAHPWGSASVLESTSSQEHTAIGKVKKAQQQASIDGDDEERGPHVRLGLFTIDNSGDVGGGPSVSLFVSGDDHHKLPRSFQLGLFVVDD